MSKSPRVNTAEFKARVALAACKGDRTLSEIVAQHQVHIKRVQGWKKQMLDGSATVFSKTDKPVLSKESEAKQAELFEQIGRLKRELDWLEKSRRPSCDGKRRQVAPKHAELSIRRPPGTQYAYFLPVAGT